MNLANMMKQAQQMQAKMAQLQDQAAQVEVTGTAGNGAVAIVMTGKGEARSVTLDPALCSADANGEDREMLQDLIVIALNDARAKADALMQDETQKLMGGLNLPAGLKLPF